MREYPRGVLRGHPHDQPEEIVRDRRTPRLAGLAPLPADQSAMPGQQCRRSYQPVRTHSPRQEPDQRRNDRPVRPVELRFRSSPAQHSALVTQHQDLRVLRCRGSGEQSQPTSNADKDQVQQPKPHDRRSRRALNHNAPVSRDVPVVDPDSRAPPRRGAVRYRPGRSQGRQSHPANRDLVGPYMVALREQELRLHQGRLDWRPHGGSMVGTSRECLGLNNSANPTPPKMGSGSRLAPI